MKKVTKKRNFVKIGLVLLVLAVVPISVSLVQRSQENRSNAAGKYNDSKCTNKNGLCLGNSQNVKENSACTVSNKDGRYIFGLCGGGNDRRCCVPYDDSKCTAKGGECVNKVKSSVKEGETCNGKTVTGIYAFNLCDGGTDRRCCVPKNQSTAAKKPTPTLTPTSTESKQSGGGGSPSNLVVATFNIGNANKTNKANAKTIGSEIKQDDFDIVGLQESHSTLTKSTVSNSGMKDYFFTNTSAGNAVISKIGLTNTKYFNITEKGDNDSFRALQKTTLSVNGKNVTFYNVHLDFHASVRDKEAKNVVNILNQDSNPWVLVGDFNFGSDCSDAYSLFNNFSIIATDEIHAGAKCTDLIIISKNRGISVVSKKTIKMDGVLSDHNLVTATLEIK
jgi:endonuclease/exonuclease/phosphatase family metal-dependent hydrolase